MSPVNQNLKKLEGHPYVALFVLFLPSIFGKGSNFGGSKKFHTPK